MHQALAVRAEGGGSYAVNCIIVRFELAKNIFCLSDLWLYFSEDAKVTLGLFIPFSLQER